MKISKVLCLLSVLGLCAAANAQITFSNAFPGTFVDISTTGGTAILGVTDDSTHTIVTTIGNGALPAGNVRVGNNGAIVGGSTTATVGFSNATIPAVGFPVGFTVGAGIVMPFWDDLYPATGATNTTIYWQQDLVNGVLTIMWKDDPHYNSGIAQPAGSGVTFEVKVFASGPYLMQYLYNDTTFLGATTINDNGVSATIGYATGSTGLNNALYSFNTASVGPGTVLTLAAPQPVFQTNQANATFTINGDVGSAFSKSVTNVTADNACSFGSVNVLWSSALVGLPWDLGIAPSVVPSSGPGFQLAGPPIQHVNLDLGLPYPTLSFLNNLVLNNAFPGGPIAFAFAPGAPFDAGAQLVVLDPGSLNSVALSQPCEYHSTVVAAPGPNPAPPVGDDVSVVCTYISACGSCAFNFFGTTYYQFAVTTNGRVMPGNSASTAYSASVAAAMTGEGTIGAWCDLNTSTNGNISFSSPSAGVARVDFNAVGFFGGTVGQNGVTMGIEMDCNTGTIQMDSFLLATAAGQQFFGIAKGTGATDPGPSGPFDGAALGAYSGPPLPTDMIYYMGTEGAGVINGLSALLFTPSTTGGSYDWMQF